MWFLVFFFSCCNLSVLCVDRIQLFSSFIYVSAGNSYNLFMGSSLQSHSPACICIVPNSIGFQSGSVWNFHLFFFFLKIKKLSSSTYSGLIDNIHNRQNLATQWTWSCFCNASGFNVSFEWLYVNEEKEQILMNWGYVHLNTIFLISHFYIWRKKNALNSFSFNCFSIKL